MLLQFPLTPALVERGSFNLGPALTSRVTSWIQETLAAWELPPETMMESSLIAEEMATNVGKYAGLEARDELELIAELGKGILRLEMRDQGKPFDPLHEGHRSQLGADIESAEIGGLGVHLVMQLTDRQSYRREGSINILSVEKDLPG
jgi:sigma-B regulation protein RsbU (phosphoserine phosphatase)